MKIRLTGKAKKGLENLSVNMKKSVNAFLQDLSASYPAPSGWNIKKMSTGDYRLKMDYRHRLIYSIEKDFIKVTYIGTREGAYK